MKKTSLQLMPSIVILKVILALAPGKAYSQAPNIYSMTPEQRNAYMAKIRAASDSGWQDELRRMHIILPTLVAQEDDANRPPGLTRKPGSFSWSDATGYTYVRSAWGGWSNYDEAKASGYTLPDPLVLKNGQPVKDA